MAVIMGDAADTIHKCAEKGDGMKKMFLFSGAVLLSGSAYFLGPIQPNNPFPALREFEIVYKASVEDFPADAATVKIWMPVASSRDGQTILERKILLTAFPTDKYDWIPSPDPTEYHTTDGIHLDPESASKYTAFLMAELQRITAK